MKWLITTPKSRVYFVWSVIALESLFFFFLSMHKICCWCWCGWVGGFQPTLKTYTLQYHIILFGQKKTYFLFPHLCRNVLVFKPAGMNFEGYSNLQFDGLHWQKKNQTLLSCIVTCKPGVIIRLVWSWAHETEGAQGVHGNCHWKSGCRIGQCGSMTAYMSMMTANWVVTRMAGFQVQWFVSGRLACFISLLFPSLLLFLTSLRRQCVRSSSNQVTGHPRVRPLKAVQTIYDSASGCTLGVWKQFSLAICTGVWKQFSLAHWPKKKNLQTGADSSLCKQLDYGFFSLSEECLKSYIYQGSNRFGLT
jgi:hypothetical protein